MSKGSKTRKPKPGPTLPGTASNMVACGQDTVTVPPKSVVGSPKLATNRPAGGSVVQIELPPSAGKGPKSIPPPEDPTRLGTSTPTVETVHPAAVSMEDGTIPGTDTPTDFGVYASFAIAPVVMDINGENVAPVSAQIKDLRLSNEGNRFLDQNGSSTVLSAMTDAIVASYATLGVKLDEQIIFDSLDEYVTNDTPAVLYRTENGVWCKWDELPLGSFGKDAVIFFQLPPSTSTCATMALSSAHLASLDSMSRGNSKDESPDSNEFPKDLSAIEATVATGNPNVSQTRDTSRGHSGIQEHARTLSSMAQWDRSYATQRSTSVRFSPSVDRRDASKDDNFPRGNVDPPDWTGAPAPIPTPLPPVTPMKTPHRGNVSHQPLGTRSVLKAPNAPSSAPPASVATPMQYVSAAKRMIQSLMKNRDAVSAPDAPAIPAQDEDTTVLRQGPRPRYVGQPFQVFRPPWATTTATGTSNPNVYYGPKPQTVISPEVTYGMHQPPPPPPVPPQPPAPPVTPYQPPAQGPPPYFGPPPPAPGPPPYFGPPAPISGPPLYFGPPAPAPGPPTPGPSASTSTRKDPILKGSDWREHRLTAAELEVYVVELNNIGQIYPWEYPRPETGSTINHPVVVNQFLTKRDDFIGRFSAGISVMDSTKMKAFTCNFPSLPDSANKGELMAFLYRVSRFANHFEIYVPPPHTYTAANGLGSWYDYLPYDVKLCVPTFDLQLHQV